MGVGVSAAEVSLESGYAQTKSRILNPTLTVFVGVYVFFGLNLWFAIQQTEFTPIIHIPIFIFQTLLGIVMFTPLHDAVHKAASPNPKINALILHGVWPIFLNAPFIFKLIHLAHHAHTNQGLDDPDHFTSAPTWKGRWIRSFLLIFSYYEYGLRKISSHPRESDVDRTVVWGLGGRQYRNLVYTVVDPPFHGVAASFICKHRISRLSEYGLASPSRSSNESDQKHKDFDGSEGA